MDKTLPSISVIIPVYDVEAYIGDCLDSVVRQTFKGRLECIIVDDRGNDRSMSIVEDYLSSYSGQIDFRIITHESNKGLSAARNSGIDAASGDYLFFLDSDDEITPDCLVALSNPLSGMSYDMVVGDFVTTGSEAKIPGLHHANGPILNNKEVCMSKFRREWYPMAVNKLYRRSFLIDNNLRFKEGIIHEDELWSAEIACLAGNMFVVRETTYVYKVREGSITTNPQTTKRLSSLIEIVGSFCSFLSDHALTCSPEANKILRTLIKAATWNACKDDKISFREQYLGVRNAISTQGIPSNSCRWKDMHLHLTPEKGWKVYYELCKLGDSVFNVKTRLLRK